VKAVELIYKFTDALHHVNDKKYKDLKVSRKVAILNWSISQFNSRLGPYYETNQLLERWFRPLKKSLVKLDRIKRNKDHDLFEVPKNMNILGGLLITAKKDDCIDRFPSSPLKHKSTFSASVSDTWIGSFKFRQAFDDIDSEGIRIYHNGDYFIVKAEANYVENIPEIHAASLTESNSYVYADGSKITFDRDLILGTGAETPIIQGAVLKARDDVSDFNLEINKIFSLNKILTDVVVNNL
jgi:hypothetical protein